MVLSSVVFHQDRQVRVSAQTKTRFFFSYVASPFDGGTKRRVPTKSLVWGGGGVSLKV